MTPHRLLLPLFAAATLSACATPEVVQVAEVGDRDLSCAELERELAEAARFEREAREDRGVTGTNVAAALLFWPGLIGTYANTGEAIEAAQDRQRLLSDIARDMGC